MEPSCPPTFRLTPSAAESRAPALTPAQARVVAHTQGPLLVLGGPGSGKTTVVAEAVVARVRAGEPCDQLLVLTSSRAAAVELRGRIAARLGGTSAPLVVTMHALCRHLVTAYGSAEPGAAPPRLLSGPDQDAVVREVLAGWPAERWPEPLRASLGTDAFVEQVRSVFARARQFGLDPDDLAALGAQAGVGEWEAAGEFFEEYLRLLDFQGVLDYGELVHRARLLLADPVTGSLIRGRIRRVFVDDIHETDPAQAGLLRQLVGPGGPILACGDPDQTVDRFRGTSSRAIVDFPVQFGLPDRPADIVALDVDHRHGEVLDAVLGRLRARLPSVGRVAADEREAWRQPEPAGPAGRVRVVRCDSEVQQADVVAARLRRAHLEQHVAWSDMAVVVRSARRSIPRLARSLAVYGVPVEVAGDEVALGEEPAVRTLLLALEVACRRRPLDADTTETLLGSPLAGLDVLARRRLAQDLRAAGQGGADGRQLLAELVADPDRAAALAPGPVSGLAGTLERARAQVDAGAPAGEILWGLWTATRWPQRLRAEALGGGDDARAAHRGLDAVCALFELAERQADEHGGDPILFLEGVQARRLPASSGAERAQRREAVRVLTAHRAKGLEWDLVCVVGAQEGSWPDLRPTAQLLHSDRLLPDGLAPAEPLAMRIGDERRLFYLACSRARRELFVTTVQDDAGLRPSRFVAELGVAPQPAEATPRPGTLAGLVAELRCVAVDESASAALREAAALRLAQLAAEVDDAGRPLAPWADPERWWGVLDPSSRSLECAAPDEPVTLTGSGLQSLLECPRRWFLERQARVQPPRPTSASLGTLVHEIVEEAARAGWDYDACVARLEARWAELRFDAPWREAHEHAAALDMLRRFAQWQAARGPGLVGVEVPFDVTLDVGTDRVRLVGAVDRLERIGGRLRVVDFKTGKTVPTAAEMAVLPQFGVYQAAVAAGGFEAVTPERESAGAVGVYLRKEVRGTVKELPQAGLADRPWPETAEPGQGETWVHARLAEAAAIVRQGEFPAQECARCRGCGFRAACPVQNEGRQVSA